MKHNEENDARYLMDAIVRFNGNIRRIATELGWCRQTVYRKLARYCLRGLLRKQRKAQ